MRASCETPCSRSPGTRNLAENRGGASRRIDRGNGATRTGEKRLSSRSRHLWSSWGDDAAANEPGRDPGDHNSLVAGGGGRGARGGRAGERDGGLQRRRSRRRVGG